MEEVLVNNMEPKRPQQRGRWAFDSFALESHLAAGRTMDARQYLDEGRFAGAVFAKKRVETARLQPQVDLAERNRRAECLGDALKLQERDAV